MYSTNIKDNRYLVRCLIVSDYISSEKFIVDGVSVRFYKHHLQQFTIGNIDMGEQDIWITFDKRVTDIILGMDILKQVIMITNPYDQKIYFCKDAEDYRQNFQLKAG